MSQATGMKAVNFVDPLKIELRDDIDIPIAGENEVIVQVRACGICGSDMHMYRTNSHRALLVRTDDVGTQIPGHEYAGVISQVGKSVEGFSVGDRVVGVGMGGMAEYTPVPVNPFQLVKIPEGVSFEEAATTEPLADGIQMVRKSAVKAGENVVIFGVGIIGLGVVQALKQSGVKLGQIVAVDVSDARLKMALEVGATATINARDADVVSEAVRICGVAPVPYPPSNPPDVSVVFDCAGYIKSMKGDAPFQTALHLVKDRVARIVMFGAFEGRFELDLMPIIDKQPTIMGSQGYAAEDLVLALEWMAEGVVDRRKLITATFPLKDAAKAFEVQDQSSEQIKVLITP